MREYELTVVFDLSVAEAGGDDAAPNHVDTLISARGGTVLKHDHWGRRRMAYPINRAVDGDYIVSRVELDPTQVTPLEATMRIDERIYRHLIVRADELPIPPPPREPRRIPGETPEGNPIAPEAPGDQPSAIGDESGSQPATEAVAAEADAEPVVAEAASPADEPTADEAAAGSPAADEADAPVAAEPAVAAVDEAEAPFVEEAEAATDEPTADEPAAGSPDEQTADEPAAGSPDAVDNAEPATDNAAEVESTDEED